MLSTIRDSFTYKPKSFSVPKLKSNEFANINQKINKAASNDLLKISCENQKQPIKVWKTNIVLRILTKIIYFLKTPAVVKTENVAALYLRILNHNKDQAIDNQKSTLKALDKLSHRLNKESFPKLYKDLRNTYNGLFRGEFNESKPEKQKLILTGEEKNSIQLYKKDSKYKDQIRKVLQDQLKNQPNVETAFLSADHALVLTNAKITEAEKIKKYTSELKNTITDLEMKYTEKLINNITGEESVVWKDLNEVPGKKVEHHYVEIKHSKLKEFRENFPKVKFLYESKETEKTLTAFSLYLSELKFGLYINTLENEELIEVLKYAARQKQEHPDFFKKVFSICENRIQVSKSFAKGILKSHFDSATPDFLVTTTGWLFEMAALKFNSNDVGSLILKANPDFLSREYLVKHLLNIKKEYVYYIAKKLDRPFLFIYKWMDEYLEIYSERQEMWKELLHNDTESLANLIDISKYDQADIKELLLIKREGVIAKDSADYQKLVEMIDMSITESTETGRMIWVGQQEVKEINHTRVVRDVDMSGAVLYKRSDLPIPFSEKDFNTNYFYYTCKNDLPNAKVMKTKAIGKEKEPEKVEVKVEVDKYDPSVEGMSDKELEQNYIYAIDYRSQTDPTLKIKLENEFIKRLNFNADYCESVFINSELRGTPVHDYATNHLYY